MTQAAAASNACSNSRFWERSVSMIAGGILLVRGLNRRSMAGYFLAAVGAELLWRGLRPVASADGVAIRNRTGASGEYYDSTEKKLQEKVDLASELSFPASDA